MNSQAQFYEWFATAYESLYKVIDAEKTVQQWNGLLQTVLPAEQRKTPLRLLDVGCGPGWHLPHWHRRGFIVAGLDFCMAMLELAKAEWSREIGEEVPPLYCADLLNLAGPILTAPPFDILVLHSNLIHLFSPETLCSLFGALELLGAPGALMMADFTSTTLLMESSRDTTEIHGMPWEHTSRFDLARGILKHTWSNGTNSMTQLTWPIEPEGYDRLLGETGWTVRSRVGWDPQDFDTPFREERNDHTRRVTIYVRNDRR